MIHNQDLIILYDCTISKATQIGPSVEIQKNVTLGARCKIYLHTFIYKRVTIGNDVPHNKIVIQNNIINEDVNKTDTHND